MTDGRRLGPRVPSPRRFPGVVLEFQRAQGEKVLAGFWQRVEPDGQCWIWQGALRNTGYGWYGRQLAHRFCYRMMKGPVAGLVVRHTCDNRLCVRPDHLLAGTQMENMRDKMAKGRWNGGRKRGKKGLSGELNNNAKISTRQAQMALHLSAEGYRQVDIARLIGITPDNVSNIVRRTTWTHLEPPPDAIRAPPRVPGRNKRSRIANGRAV